MRWKCRVCYDPSSLFKLCGIRRNPCRVNAELRRVTLHAIFNQCATAALLRRSFRIPSTFTPHLVKRRSSAFMRSVPCDNNVCFRTPRPAASGTDLLSLTPNFGWVKIDAHALQIVLTISSTDLLLDVPRINLNASKLLLVQPDPRPRRR